jgi:hypothetical protein
MVEITYENSPYRFTDPIRLFKANDPYYFEIDNIPIKQLQENCLWLKDQIRTLSQPTLSAVKRADLDELRPFANGGDRTIRVNPGRYTARINDASLRTPLAYLRKVMGEAVGDVDAWETALPNAGTFDEDKDLNGALETSLNKFKTIISQNALGMNGLVERAFTWPLINSDKPINNTGAVSTSTTNLSYGGSDDNDLGGNASYAPFIVAQALLWAKSKGSGDDRILLSTYDTTDDTNGWAKLPKTENYFIKAWRGVARLAIVDVDQEIQVEVPVFDPKDFSYVDEDGNETAVNGVKQRIDLVFIYSKPIDLSAVNILNKNGKQTITKPTLGIVKGAGIKVRYQESNDINKDYIVPTQDSILANPADQFNENMGFTSTSSNDIAADVRGSFPAPDDILNIAPLLSEKLENTAYELVGQSILPVAYVFVQEDSQLILPSDVIDIRPFFRTAELAYNERAGIAAAFPQLSLANPAVGKAQLDLEVKKLKDSINFRIDASLLEAAQAQRRPTVAAVGYVFGGWNFGPEGALYDYYSRVLGAQNLDTTSEDIKDYIVKQYGYGGLNTNIPVPVYPDWDKAQWCVEEDLDYKGLYPNDYINVFLGVNTGDSPLVAASYKDGVSQTGAKIEGGTPERIAKLLNDPKATRPFIFYYVSKRIKFQRPTWLADYKIDVNYVNCLPKSAQGNDEYNGTYFGHWVEKGDDSFTIYVAFYASQQKEPFNVAPGYGIDSLPFPGPYFATTYKSVKKKKANNLKKKKSFVPTGELQVIQRDGARFSSFLVPVSELMYSNTDPIGDEPFYGFQGNPRAAICTYPTVMWSFTAIPVGSTEYLYGNLNATAPVITLKGD